MGTNRDSELESPQQEEEPAQTSRSAEPAEPAQEDDNNPLNTYKWRTGPGAEPGQNPFQRLEKGAAKKLSKMQTWRKTLSEDSGSSAAKPEKPAGTRKNPFRRALSEPPGALLSSVLPQPGSGSGSGSGSGPAAQKGKIRKYLNQVSQRLKRPRLQTHTTITEHDVCMEVVSAAHDAERLSWCPPQDVPVWDINYCVLQDGQIIIPREEECVLTMRRRAGSCVSSLSLQNLTENHNIPECTPDHTASASAPKPKVYDGGVKAKIKRRLQGPQKKLSNTQLNTVGLGQVGRFGSRESLSVPVCVAESLDLGADVCTVIRPVHSSILGEKFCFEVINSENNHCFGCSSAAERDRWIENLRRAAQPNKDNCERTENCLSLWVNEAKDLLPKRRYYCELYLDRVLFARTSSRAVSKSSQNQAGEGGAGGGGAGGGQLFWGELFELDHLPPVQQVTLHLFRDEDPKKKRHSREENLSEPLGSLVLPLAQITGRLFQEKWFPLVPHRPAGSAGREQLGPQASLRVRARFQNLRVLPIERYKEFAEHLTVGYVGMCSSLEPHLNLRDKEELAGALVHVLQSIGKAKEFLVHLGSAEVLRLGENQALIFRENSLATKAIDEYMKLVGQKYLINTLGDFISQLYSTSESCEVDPTKCSAADLSINQQNLKKTCGEVVQLITQMHSSFPVELNEIFSSWVSDCETGGRAEVSQRLITSSLFLRFLCPAVLSPSLFNLTQPYPEPHTLRTLTLTAKVIQNLANFTLFGEKEEYMLFMNDFLEQKWEVMREFLQRVSSPDSELSMSHFDGYVDLPLRLAVLHDLLVDIISPMKQETIDDLHPLPSILNQISEHLGPEARRITCSSAGQSKPSYVPPRDLAKYSPLNKSLQHLPTEPKPSRDKQRKQVARTQSVPTRHHRPAPRRQTSNEDLHRNTEEVQPEEEAAPLMDISSPQPIKRHKPPPAPVPWIIVNNKEPHQVQTEPEETSLLDKHGQELSELRLGVESVADRQLEAEKRLEDFIIQTQEQNQQLLTELQDLQNLLIKREEQLASTTFRLGVIEEEREEDERKLSVALAAAERMNVLEEQFAGLLKEMQKLSLGHNDKQISPHIPS